MEKLQRAKRYSSQQSNSEAAGFPGLLGLLHTLSPSFAHSETYWPSSTWLTRRNAKLGWPFTFGMMMQGVGLLAVFRCYLFYTGTSSWVSLVPGRPPVSEYRVHGADSLDERFDGI